MVETLNASTLTESEQFTTVPKDQLVFAFNPHETDYWAHPADLVPLPAALSSDDAAFLPNMETAVNFLHDGRPLVGECVVVFGQGILGLLTTALLARLPLEHLITLDRYQLRCQASSELGAHVYLDPTDVTVLERLRSLLQSAITPGADLVYEHSGSPAALDDAIALAGFDGRIVVGS